MTRITGFFLLTLFAGCEQQILFNKPGAAPGSGQGDVVDCQVEALAAVPPNNQLRTIDGGPETTYANCSRYSCTATTYGGQDYVYSVDENAGLRDQVLIQCMSRRGYTASYS